MPDATHRIQALYFDGKFLGLFIAAEDLDGDPITIHGTAEDWKRAALIEGSHPIWIKEKDPNA